MTSSSKETKATKNTADTNCGWRKKCLPVNTQLNTPLYILKHCGPFCALAVEYVFSEADGTRRSMPSPTL